METDAQLIGRGIVQHLFLYTLHTSYPCTSSGGACVRRRSHCSGPAETTGDLGLSDSRPRPPRLSCTKPHPSDTLRLKGMPPKGWSIPVRPKGRPRPWCTNHPGRHRTKAQRGSPPGPRRGPGPWHQRRPYRSSRVGGSGCSAVWSWWAVRSSSWSPWRQGLRLVGRGL